MSYAYHRIVNAPLMLWLSCSDVYTAKLCLLASIFGCLDAALTIAATLNSKSFFVTPFGREGEADTVKRSFKAPDEHSDFLVIYRAYKAWRSNCANGGWSTFCRKHFLSHQVGGIGSCARSCQTDQHNRRTSFRWKSSRINILAI